MRARFSILLTPALLLLILAACGMPTTSATLPGPTATRVPGAATPMLPLGQKPPRPVPDPAAVASGAPLRAILLAQIDLYAQGLSPCTATGTPVVSCSNATLRELRKQSPELDAYVSWRDAIWYCISDGKGGYTRMNTAVYYPPTPEELREPAMLDVYVSGTPWCDQTRPR